ncbi:hypothetical protein EI94DRAFT_1725291 [Lactarius quietus]|nr:hypothetical protein EI94DRAFT_1725291 [Lactarius quietus]
MLSSVLRRTLLRSGTLFSAWRLPCGFATTTSSDLNSGDTEPSRLRVKRLVTINPKDLPPKHPGSAYTTWPDSLLAAQNRMREGAQIWHTVSEYDKQQTREKHEGIKAEYERRMQEWRETINPSVLRELNRRRVDKGLSRIRGPSTGYPLSGFLRFFREVRENTPRTQEVYRDHFKEVAALAGKQWKAMSEEEKAKYNGPANAELAAWREKRKAEGDAKQ